MGRELRFARVPLRIFAVGMWMLNELGSPVVVLPSDIRLYDRHYGYSSGREGPSPVKLALEFIDQRTALIAADCHWISFL
ncbi:hypothetical protein An16g02620 [Aspergillus niger]|uniref:Uncharacterized protein n=2 Tax=Aspergillus niger TaxID=5061 RepID=A2R783_ASPNC|nr:hypothetical protein An16g02620 [Aspergillus niger]CAK46792.1 hypothetical protein An16g02620 [Aspergillus niger]